MPNSYIKEFVHGDFGRTKPNLGALMETEVDILELDVEVCWFHQTITFKMILDKIFNLCSQLDVISFFGAWFFLLGATKLRELTRNGSHQKLSCNFFFVNHIQLFRGETQIWRWAILGNQNHFIPPKNAMSQLGTWSWRHINMAAHKRQR